MHYKNGREAKAGDKIINLDTGHSGILHSPNAQASSCNGRLAAISQNDPYVNIGDCLHIDDIKAATIPSTVALLLMLFALFACFAGNASAGDAKTTASSELFRSGEFDLSVGGTASIGTAQREAEAVVLGTQVGGDYFVTRNLGLGARAELNDFGHSVVDRASGRLTVRAPLWDRVSPYGFVEGGYQFEKERVFAGAGGGVELRLNKNVGGYAELGMETDTRGVGTGRAAAGIRMPF